MLFSTTSLRQGPKPCPHSFNHSISSVIQFSSQSRSAIRKQLAKRVSLTECRLPSFRANTTQHSFKPSTLSDSLRTPATALLWSTCTYARAPPEAYHAGVVLLLDSWTCASGGKDSLHGQPRTNTEPEKTNAAEPTLEGRAMVAGQ